MSFWNLQKNAFSLWLFLEYKMLLEREASYVVSSCSVLEKLSMKEEVSCIVFEQSYKSNRDVYKEISTEHYI